MTWVDRAACIGHPLEWFFPTPGPRFQAYVKKAKAICAECPVRVECLEYAMTFDHRANPGIWGGTTENDRYKLHRTRVINKH